MKIRFLWFMFCLAGILLLSVAAGSARQNNVSTNYLPILLRPRPTLSSGPIQWSDQPAFDRCNPPSVAQMQTWWDQSPYWSIGIYLGGISYPSGCNNSNLTREWVTAVNGQGWSFIPIWVGPQSYCYFNKPIAPERLPKVMSQDIGAAYQQGRNEAEAAVAAARNVGLAGDGSSVLIYYDLEFYNYSGEPIAECREAVRAFTYGWTLRLHELGNKAGMYGSGCSYAADWATIPEPLDDVWLASWYKIDGQYQYDPNASVWNALCISNDLWNNHQRIRQYAGAHGENWGGVSMTIDSNIADGEVVHIPAETVVIPTWTATPSATPTATATLTPSLTITPTETLTTTATQTPSVTPSLTATPSVAYIQPGEPSCGGAGQCHPYTLLHKQRALRTQDGGQTWQDVTPALEAGETPLALFFLNEQLGWLLATSPGNLSLAIHHTADGGNRWQRFFLPEGLAVPTGELAQLRSFQFVDPQTGLLAFRLPSSSAFSRGFLLRSDNGGRTWRELPLPLGERASFSDPFTGWVSGGPGENQAYRTQDGGQTWQEVSPASLPAQHEPATLPAGSVQANFVTSQEAWAQTANGTCPTGKSSCRLEIAWWHTVDGGKTWQRVRLP